VVFAGNVLGLVAYQLAMQIVVPWLWSQMNGETTLLGGVLLIALSAIALAAPPVLLGALGAWLARRDELWVGLACGLWGVSLVGRVPEFYPIARGVWYAPAVLIILSSALGGWLIDLREQAYQLMTKDR
jgi:hypothetical protein